MSFDLGLTMFVNAPLDRSRKSKVVGWEDCRGGSDVLQQLWPCDQYASVDH